MLYVYMHCFLFVFYRKCFLSSRLAPWPNLPKHSSQHPAYRQMSKMNPQDSAVCSFAIYHSTKAVLASHAGVLALSNKGCSQDSAMFFHSRSHATNSLSFSLHLYGSLPLAFSLYLSPLCVSVALCLSSCFPLSLNRHILLYMRCVYPIVHSILRTRNIHNILSYVHTQPTNKIYECLQHKP